MKFAVRTLLALTLAKVAQSQTSAGSCYNPATHVVTCDVSDDTCPGTSYYYEPGYVSSHSGCCHCRASCETYSEECGYYDDEQDTTDAAQGAGNDDPNVSAGSCYNPSTHVVQCDVSDADCPETSYFYEPGYVSGHSGCCHCRASCETTSEECSYYDEKEDTTSVKHGEQNDDPNVSAGSCYDPSTHVVQCDVSDADCAETSYFYEPGYLSGHSGCCHCRASCENTSDECSYYDDEEDTADANHGHGKGDTANGGHSGEGESAGSCYDPTTHIVQCDVSDAECPETSYFYEPGYTSSHSGCCHCRASCENISDECSYYDDPEDTTDATHGSSTDVSAGSCYSADTHVVTCNVSKAKCPTSDFHFPTGHVGDDNGCCHCASGCEVVSDNCSYYDDYIDTADATHGSNTGVSAGSCYSMSTHVVTCDVSEAKCAEADYHYETGYVSGHTGCCHCRSGCEDTSNENCSYYDDEVDTTDAEHGHGSNNEVDTSAESDADKDEHAGHDHQDEGHTEAPQSLPHGGDKKTTETETIPVAVAEASSFSSSFRKKLSYMLIAVFALLAL